MKPLYVHYYDSDSFVIYNLTKAQYEMLKEKDTGDEGTMDKFLVGEGHEDGYISSEMAALAKLADFEVGTE